MRLNVIAVLVFLVSVGFDIGLSNLPFFNVVFIKGPLGGAHLRPSVYARHTVSDWRKEACHPKSASAGGDHHDGMHCEEQSRNGANLFKCWAAEKCVACICFPATVKAMLPTEGGEGLLFLQNEA